MREVEGKVRELVGSREERREAESRRFFAILRSSVGLSLAPPGLPWPSLTFPEVLLLANILKHQQIENERQKY